MSQPPDASTVGTVEGTEPPPTALPTDPPSDPARRGEPADEPAAPDAPAPSVEVSTEASTEAADTADRPARKEVVRREQKSRASAKSSGPQTVEQLLAPYTHLLGVLSDIEIASRTGLSAVTVRAYRTGESPPSTPVRVKRDSPRSKAARPAPKEAAADRRGSKVDAVRHLVGVLPDHEVAKLAGITASGVLQYRQRHGIAAAPRRASDDRAAAEVAAAAAEAESRRAPAEDTKHRPSRIDPVRHLVGVLSDRLVAEQAGVTTGAVQMYRRSRGIPAAVSVKPGAPANPTPPAPPTHAPAAAAPRPTPPRSAGAGSAKRITAVADASVAWGWRATLSTPQGEAVRVVVASDASSACRAAATLGEVVSLVRLEQALV